MAKRHLHRVYFVMKPDHVNVRYEFYRDVLSKDALMLVINRFEDGIGDNTKYISSAEMNDVMYNSAMANFKKWCYSYILNSGDFDPELDRIMEV